MKILFLDQSGQPGGAELCLIEIAKPYRDRSLVCLFTDGPFRQLLEQHQISVHVLAAQPLQIRKDSNWRQGIGSLGQLLPMAFQVAQLSSHFDLIYANTQKAMVVGALASMISRRPLVYHLHDILSLEHFSAINLRLAVTLANRFATQVLATSEAARSTFIAAGGRSDLTQVVYNGFDPAQYDCDRSQVEHLKQQLGLEGFLVGHFSRLSPWKGQHVLLTALQHCPDDVHAIFVGDALYGEQEYVQQLQAQVAESGLQKRVKFLGFRSDVVPLMHCCDVIAHTSIAPEPFGRVIVEAMLCGRPLIAAQAGGAIELLEPNCSGWLVPPNDPAKLATVINLYRSQTEQIKTIAQQVQTQAKQRFHRDVINQQIAQLLDRIFAARQSPPITAELSSLKTLLFLRQKPRSIPLNPP